MHVFVDFFLLFCVGCSLISAQSCSLPVNATTIVMPNFSLNITDPYELVISSSVVLQSKGAVVMREQMNFLEWGSGKISDIECRSTTQQCVKRWIFDEKQSLTILTEEKSCDYYNANFSINVLVSGIVYQDKSNLVVTGYKQLLQSFSKFNATMVTVNISEQAFAFDFGIEQVSMYTLCVDFPQLNTSGTVEVYVVETAQKEISDIVGEDRPYMVRITLNDVDKGVFLNNSKNNELVNVTLTFRVRYSKPPFTRDRSPSDMIVPMDVYCPFTTTEKNLTLPNQKRLHVTIEESLDEDKTVVIRDERVDFDAKLFRRTFVVPAEQFKKNKKIYQFFDNWMGDYQNSNLTIHLIHDYNYGVEWAVIPGLDKCFVRQIPLQSPEASVVKNSTNVKLDKDLLAILNFDSTTGYVYYGEYRHRAIPVSVFGTKKTDFPVKGSDAVIKLFVASPSWALDNSDQSPLVGAQMFVSDGKSSYHYKANIVQVELDQDIWLSDDFRSCAGNVSVYSVSFNDTGAASLCDALNGGDISLSDLESKVADKISQSFSISRLRIGDVLLACHPNGSVVDISFRITERLSGVTAGNIVDAPTISELKQVIDLFNKTVNSGNWSVEVPVAKKTYTVTAIKQTLRLAGETVVVNGTAPIIYNTTVNGHTSGEMVGLAIAMLIVGIMAALFGVYLYQRRRNAQFSYMVQE